METYAARKREKNILDFSDLEHFALEILLKKEGGEIKLTQAARELSLRYEEVMVDEYQDSNLVQEYLMNAVSGWAKQQDNLFMVGDVKQSIYRFRMARPELFMDKMKRYALASVAEDRKAGAHADVRDQRIDLNRNFRSRVQVLDSVNYLFFQIMREELGGVEYDQAAALNPGAVFPPKEREYAITKEYGAVFIIGIGCKLSNGEKHDGRAPDYDDWSTIAENGQVGLNGDLLVWDEVLNRSLELSSMGIRVDKEALLRQLEICNAEEKKELYFHKRLLNNELPLSIGGGIGQSRPCMFYLRKAHIGEIQASIWPEEMRREARPPGMYLI